MTYLPNFCSPSIAELVWWWTVFEVFLSKPLRRAISWWPRQTLAEMWYMSTQIRWYWTILHRMIIPTFYILIWTWISDEKPLKNKSIALIDSKNPDTWEELLAPSIYITQNSESTTAHDFDVSIAILSLNCSSYWSHPTDLSALL